MGGWAAMGLAVAHGDRVRSLVLADTLAGIPIEGWWKRAATVQREGLFNHPALSNDFCVRHPERAHLYLQIGGLRRDPHADPVPVLRTMADVTFSDEELAAIGRPDALRRRHRRRDLPAGVDRRSRDEGPGRPGRIHRRRRALPLLRAARGVEHPGAGISPGMPVMLAGLGCALG